MAATLVSAAPALAADYPAYLGGPSHSSVAPDATITAADVPSLALDWNFTPPHGTMTGQPAPNINSTPTVYDGVAYVGDESGELYALNLHTGSVLWSRFVGFIPALTCTVGRGVSSTAAEAVDPTTAQLTVYVSGGDGYLYALSAADGSIVWRSLIAAPDDSVNGYYDWSSPTVINGKVYIGLSGDCDNPFERGGLNEYDQSTGALLATAWFVPPGVVGAGIWSSVAVDPDNQVFATSGSTTPPPYPQAGSYTIYRLDGDTLAQEDSWTIPSSERKGDADFGASPVLFSATIGGVTSEMVGALDKNGVFYAFLASNLAQGPVWQTRVALAGQFALAAAIWDGTTLYVASPATTIGGTPYRGSIRALDPDTGAVEWETGLNGQVVGTPSMNGAGVIAVSTWDTSPNGTYFVDSSTGAILRYVSDSNSKEFAQPVFSGNDVLLGTVSRGIDAYSTVTPTFADGFESGTFSQWTYAQGMQAVSGGAADGTWFALADSTGSAAYASKRLATATSNVDVSMSFNVMSNATPGTVTLVRLVDSSNHPIASVRVGSTGRLTVRDFVTATTYGSSSVVTPGWHTLELRVSTTGAAGAEILSLDGQRQAGPSRIGNFGTNPVAKVVIGDATAGKSYSIGFDDVAVSQVDG